MNFKTIILSRTDSIGDVVLTLPMAGVIKKHYPNCKVIFVGKTYTQPVINLSVFVDEFINWDEMQKMPNPVDFLKQFKADAFIHVFPNRELAAIVKKANIPFRIGTYGRLFHWLSCNKLVVFSRKKSNLHESQLNLKLLAPIGISKQFELEEIPSFYGLEKIPTLNTELEKQIDKNKINVILHPKSRGSAKEWGIENYFSLSKILPKEQFKVFVCGTTEEGLMMGGVFVSEEQVVSLVGKLTLTDYIAFISKVDALIAASTGPLHIAAALGKYAIGLYSPKRPIHPGRWMPVGNNAHAVVFNPDCEKCKNKIDCNCISTIKPNVVAEFLFKYRKPFDTKKSEIC